MAGVGTFGAGGRLVAAAMVVAVAVLASGAEATGEDKRFTSVLDVSAWNAAVTAGVDYAPSDFSKIGFIHCSRLNQTAWVLNRFYNANTTALTAVISTMDVKAPVDWVYSVPGMDSFPHIMGKLNLDAVIRVVSVNRSSTSVPWDEASVCKQVGGCV